MSFEEIAEREGISRQYAHDIYMRAIVKLRKRFPNALELMQMLAGEMREAREERRPNYESL